MQSLSSIHNWTNFSGGRVEDFGACNGSLVTDFSCYCSYALDVNTERAEDVLMHKKLLNMARDPLTRPAVDVRLVQVYPRMHRHDSVQLSLQLVFCRIPSSICIIFLHDIYWKLQDSAICGGHE